MPKASKSSTSGNGIQEYGVLSDTWVTCLVCPEKNGSQLSMHKKHTKKHGEGQTHLRYLAYAQMNQSQASERLFSTPPASSSAHGLSTDQLADYNDFSVEDEFAVDTSMSFHPETVDDSPGDTLVDDLEPISFGDLWNAASTNRTFHLGDEVTDFYAEALRDLQSGERLFSLGQPLAEEMGMETEGCESYGIEIPTMFQSSSARMKKRSPVSVDSPTYPWPSQSMFKTDILFSSPRMPFSQAQKSAVLNWAKELHAVDVPSLYTLQKCRREIQELVGNPTEKITSRSGDVFYINDVASAIAKDFSNPITRFSMQDYPEDGGNGMSQVFHGEKMLLDLPPETVSPCVRVNGQIFFVNELLQRSSEAYFIPERFFYRTREDSGSEGIAADPFFAKELYALGHDVQESPAGFVVDEEKSITPVSTFLHTYEDLSNEKFPEFSACSASHGAKMPHPLREKAGGRMVYTVPLIVFMDDVSGNISKQWNKHHAIYMSNACMPREMLEKEFCVRFVTSSPHASPMDLMAAMRASICKAAESGVIAYDCKFDEEALLCPYGLFFGGDNPMQAEECSHGGLRCNYFCRTCKVGGSKAFKESDEGFPSIFKSAELRTPEETEGQIREQIRLASLPGGTEKVKDAVASTGTRDATTASIVNCLLAMGKGLRKREAGKVAMSEAQVRALLDQELENRITDSDLNPLIGMPGVNIHMDTPTEILHTILLGVVKYFWGQTVFILEKSHMMAILQARLASIDANGLNAPSLNADYICRYKGGLIGKHMKSLAQVMPFLIYDLVPQTVLNAWMTIGELVVLLWHTEIMNTEEYLADLSRVIDDFLSITAQCAPSILISKPKFHFLVHIPAYVRRFGPAILFSTERYESFNHVFRLTCIYSNRRSPSRDTCSIFAAQDVIKHIATGGFWLEPSSQKWVRGGKAVLDYVKDHPEVAHVLGLHETTTKDTTGYARLLTTAGIRAPPIPWARTQCASILPSPGNSLSSTPYSQAASFSARNGDQVLVSKHVIYCDSWGGRVVGRVDEILVPEGGKQIATDIAIQPFEFLPSLHPIYQLPSLQPTSSKEVIKPENILCIANLQHDCAMSGCAQTQSHVIQERTETTKTCSTISHSPTDKFLLNRYSIHNYQHILSSIPSHLRSRTSMVPNHDEVRRKAAKHIRDTKAKNTNTSGVVSQNTEAPANQLSQGPEYIIPAFEKPPAQVKTKAKRKGSTKSTATRSKVAATALADQTSTSSQVSTHVTADTHPSSSYNASTLSSVRYHPYASPNHLYAPPNPHPIISNSSLPPYLTSYHPTSTQIAPVYQPPSYPPASSLHAGSFGSSEMQFRWCTPQQPRPEPGGPQG